MADARTLLQFQHPERTRGVRAMPVPAALSAETVAALFGLEPAALQEAREGFRRSVEQAADELLGDPQLAADLRQLPLAAGETLVALGDSITDDLQSWAEILAVLLERARPGERLRVVNHGVTGDTTTHALERLDALLPEQPAWVVVALGSNDAKRVGPEGGRRMVSARETARNLEAIEAIVREWTGARIAWITTPPFDPRQWADGFLAELGLRWRAEDLREAAEIVRARGGIVADVHAAFLDAGPQRLLLPDGVHPNLAGQRLIVRTLCRALAQAGATTPTEGAATCR
jgi:lysophospholipase L1-like esterase